MAEAKVHTELTMFLDGFPLPLAKPDHDQAALDASFGDPTSNSTQHAANSGAAYTSSFHLLPEKDCASQDPSAYFENPSAQSRAHVSCFAHSHSVSAYTKNLQADCAGLSCPVALSKGTQVHLASGNEGRMDPQQISLEYPTVACMASREEGVHSLNEGQADPTELLSMASLNSCEESTSLNREGGDSRAPKGSYEDVGDLQTGCDDDVEDFAYAHRIRGVSANGLDGVQGPLEEVPDPSLQQADADATTGSLQPCSSECSSVISMVSPASPEITSRLDSNCANVDAMESYWTDAKHGSYLDYMETSFVKNLYGREYCALDVCGQQPSHQGSQISSPWPATLFEFKSWQSGDWHRRSMLKPPLLTCIPLALRPSPWVNHFRHRKVPRAKQIKIEDVCTFYGIDGRKEVDSSSNEVNRGVHGHDHTSGSNFEFAHDPENPRRGNTKKWGLESNREKEQAGQVFEEYMCR